MMRCRSTRDSGGQGHQSMLQDATQGSDVQAVQSTIIIPNKSPLLPSIPGPSNTGSSRLNLIKPSSVHCSSIQNLYPGPAQPTPASPAQPSPVQHTEPNLHHSNPEQRRVMHSGTEQLHTPVLFQCTPVHLPPNRVHQRPGEITLPASKLSRLTSQFP
ncbi:hypothetical protein E2C01_091638 [Portunus trituberculatus]|uniref:Uncharacterized protein n=1 Tax=Portunus trituberculatus TaxID=210409 RepID=A0A5B7JTF6_PORTR|nr:hypothetical protein [Portunus trituberculatus]